MLWTLHGWRGLARLRFIVCGVSDASAIILDVEQVQTQLCDA